VYQPTISIITVCYNADTVLEGTIRSVLKQTYPDIEYLIIEGASTDGTLDIINQYRNSLSRVVSEPDRGLYDAMNKGLRLATGDFVWFLNAGDELFASDTVEKAVSKLSPETDVFYGETMLVNNQRQRIGKRSELTTQQLPELLTWRSLKMGMVVGHQAFVVNRRIAPEYRTDNLSADVDWVIRCLKKAKKIVNTQLILVDYLMGGVSKKRHRKSLLDRFKVLHQHFGLFQNLYNHIGIVGRSLKQMVGNNNPHKY
jgi:glycosyltransferase involved in cell wall biosynthesis